MIINVRRFFGLPKLKNKELVSFVREGLEKIPSYISIC